MRTIYFALVLGSLLGRLAVEARAQGPYPNYIVAIVHDSIITRLEVLKLTEPILVALYDRFKDDPQLLRQKEDQAIQDTLNLLIERKLILRDFETSGYNLPESIIDEQIQERIRKRYGDRARLTQTLRAQGLTHEAFRKEIREQIIEDALRAKHVSMEIIISPHKIEAFYATNQSQFKMEDQVKLRMIRVIRATPADLDPVKKRAQEILAKIESGTPFAEMAGIYHQGSQPGGDWGWVTETTLSRGLSDIFFKLKAGQHTGLIGRAANESEKIYWIYQYDKQGRLRVARKYGEQEGKELFLEEKRLDDPAAPALALPEPQEFYLLLVEETRGSHVQPLAEVRDDIENALIVEEHARLQKKWIDRLRAKIFWRQIY